MFKQQAPRRAKVAEPIARRHMAVVSPEHMDVFPRPRLAIRLARQQPVEAFRARAPGEADGEATIPPLQVRRNALCRRPRHRVCVGDNDQLTR
jgi:hypothetical protein